MRELGEGPKTIHVHRPAILEGEEGVFIIRRPGEQTIFCGHIEIMGHSQMVNRPEAPMGKRVVVETYAKVMYQ